MRFCPGVEIWDHSKPRHALGHVRVGFAVMVSAVSGSKFSEFHSIRN